MSPENRPHQNDLWWNVLTFITLGTLILVLVVMVVIYRDPAASVNPFPPPTQTPTPAPPTSTPTPIELPEIWTATPEANAPTPRASSTLPLSQVAITALPEDSLGIPSPTPPSGGFSYVMKGQTAVLDGSVFHPEWGCAWMGVAGQAEDWLDRPAKGIQVVVGGQIGDRVVDMTTLSGTALQYGPGGYEFKLANGPYATERTLWIQLFDQASKPLSKKVYFSTSGKCEANLVIINFEQPN